MNVDSMYPNLCSQPSNLSRQDVEDAALTANASFVRLITCGIIVHHAIMQIQPSGVLHDSRRVAVGDKLYNAYWYR